MNDENLLLKTEMLRLTVKIMLYEKKTFLIRNIFFQIKQCSNGTV